MKPFNFVARNFNKTLLLCHVKFIINFVSKSEFHPIVGLNIIIETCVMGFLMGGGPRLRSNIHLKFVEYRSSPLTPSENCDMPKLQLNVLLQNVFRRNLTCAVCMSSCKF